MGQRSLTGEKRPAQVIEPADDEAVEVFNQIYEANYRAIWRFGARLLKHADAAEEIAQESYARLWKELESGTRLDDPRAWLYRVAANLVTTKLRRKLRAANHRPKVEEHIQEWQTGSIDFERQVIYREIVPIILSRLPEPMRACLLLYHEGLTGNEIAHVLSIKSSYVGTLVLRAHERFRREYERLEKKS